MSHLWALKRRSSSLVRYFHGGTTALYPWQSSDSMPALLFEAYALALATANTAEDNILFFPARDGRLSQARHGTRFGSRLRNNKS